MIRSTNETTADVWIFKDGADQGERENRPRVHFEDLNLSRRDDVKILYGRIRAAADAACSPLAHSHILSIHRKWIDCRAIEIANAVLAFDHPGLTEFHRQSTTYAIEGA
jgi:UrcA family protein